MALSKSDTKSMPEIQIASAFFSYSKFVLVSNFDIRISDFIHCGMKNGVRAAMVCFAHNS